eukprot:10209351-Lingulodinium_polyedra.AAC.1
MAHVCPLAPNAQHMRRLGTANRTYTLPTSRLSALGLRTLAYPGLVRLTDGELQGTSTTESTVKCTTGSSATSTLESNTHCNVGPTMGSA